MRTALFPALALLLGGCPPPGEKPAPDDDTDSPIEAGTETVSTSWDVDLFSEYESPTIATFDTLDGRRKLDSMVITVDHTAEMTVAVENGTEVALAGGDYSAELYFQTIIQLGIEDEPPAEGEEGPPFFGPGAFLAVVDEALAPADGDPEGGDDQYSETITDTIQFEAPYDPVETPRYLDALTGTEPLQLVVGGFSELWVYWNEDHGGTALINAGATAIQYSGTMTVTYAYSPVE